MASQHAVSTQDATHRADVWITIVFTSLVLAPLPAHATTFENVAPAMGIVISPNSSGHSVGGGVSFLDANGDGLLDILTTTITVPPILFRQVSGGFVKDEFAVIPDSPPGVGNGHLIIDFDNDNDDDILLLTADKNVLFRNDDGVFVDVTHSHCPYQNLWSSSAAAGDFDGDGDLDIYIANYIMDIAFPKHRCAPNELWINDGNGRFVDRAVEWGVEGAGCSLATAMTDYDNDGDLDIMVANDFGQYTQANVLYRNDGPATNGAWTFTDVSKETGWDRELYGMGIATSDINDDGWLDYFVTSIGNPALLLGGPSGFIDATSSYGANIELSHEGFQVCWGTSFADFNGDGWLDLLSAGGHIPATGFIANAKVQPHVLLAGGPTLPWTEMPTGWDFPAIENNNGRGISLGDYNQDGHVDVALVDAEGMLSLYKNKSTGAVPLRIRLRATQTHPAAIGARLTATCGDKTRVREQSGGGGFAGSHDPTIRFTFPGNCLSPGEPVGLLIRWPSGYTQSVQTTTGALIDVKEPHWLAIDNDQISVTPTGGQGLPLPESTTVSVSTIDGQVLETTHIGDGTWQSAIPGTDTLQLRFTIAGKEWPIHPRVQPPQEPGAQLWFWPQKPVIGQPMTVYARPSTGTGNNPQEWSLQVKTVGSESTIGMSSAPYEINTYYAIIPPTSQAEEFSITVEKAGEVVAGPVYKTPAPRVSDEETSLKFINRYVPVDQLKTTALTVTMAARDTNYDPSEVVAADFSLTANGLPVEPILQNAATAQLMLGYAAEDVPDGAMLQLWFDEKPFGQARPMVHLAAESEQFNYVAAEYSRCSVSMETMVADGQDLLFLLMFLRDAYDDTLIKPTEQPVFQTDLFSILPESLDTSDEYISVVAIAGTQSGEAAIVPTLYGQPLPMECNPKLVAPQPSLEPLDFDKSELVVSPNSIAASGEATADIEIFPRHDNSRLYGSGLSWNVETTLGAISQPPRYNGRGGYVGTLQSGLQPGTATVTTESTMPPLLMKATVDFFDINGPTDPDPDPNADTTTDTSESSDVQEPVDTAEAGDGGTPTDPDAIDPEDSETTQPDVPKDTSQDGTEPTEAVESTTDNGTQNKPDAVESDSTSGEETTQSKPGGSSGGCKTRSGPNDRLPIELLSLIVWALLHMRKRFCNHGDGENNIRGTH